jgi:hypothetical protein
VLLDELMPAFDATRIEHRVIGGPPERVYDAALHADFMQAFSESRAARALVTARTTAERIVSTLRSGAQPPLEEPADAMTLAGLGTHGEYVLLGADPPHEIAFGMIGRFWGGETRWEEIEASEFRTFSRPGLARIACNLSLRPYGDARTLVSYESRTEATDATARRAFLRYWRVVAPLAGVVLRAQLAVVARDAAGRPR